MICPVCKQNVAEGSSFCPNCGAKLAENVVYVPLVNNDPTYESRRVARIIAIIGCIMLGCSGWPISIILGAIALNKSNEGMDQVPENSQEWKSWKTVHTLANVSLIVGVCLLVILIIIGLVFLAISNR